jgi:hypothetical protein
MPAAARRSPIAPAHCGRRGGAYRSGPMPRARDIYDVLPSPRAEELRRLNAERLARLEAAGAARRARLVRAAQAAAGPRPRP